MMIAGLIFLGLLVGLGATIFVVGTMMKKPGSRIWLANSANFSRGRPPEHCAQLIRHGKWIARPEEEENT